MSTQFDQLLQEIEAMHIEERGECTAHLEAPSQQSPPECPGAPIIDRTRHGLSLPQAGGETLGAFVAQRMVQRGMWRPNVARNLIVEFDNAGDAM